MGRRLGRTHARHSRRLERKCHVPVAERLPADVVEQHLLRSDPRPAGAKPGEAFVPHGWEDVHIAFAQLEAGDAAAGRATMEEVLAGAEEPWGGHYNLACYLSLAGEKRRAVRELAFAIELNDVFRYKVIDEPDFDPLRGDPEFVTLTSIIV